MKTILTTTFFCFCIINSAAAQMRIIYPDNAKAVSFQLPIFSEHAKDPLYGDEIRVLVDVGINGRVKAAIAYWPLVPCSNLENPIVEEMRKAASSAAQTIIFEPFQKDGKPVEERVSVGYSLRSQNVPLSDEKKVVSIGIANGRATSLPKPNYPDAAKAVGAGGAITVQVLIDETGAVVAAGSISGHPLFASSGMKAACSAHFSPMKLRGDPAKMLGFISYNFVP